MDYDKRGSMSAVDHRIGVFATLCAMAGLFFVIVDVGETPWVFENAHIEIALFVPIVLWLVSRGLLRRR